MSYRPEWPPHACDMGTVSSAARRRAARQYAGAVSHRLPPAGKSSIKHPARRVSTDQKIRADGNHGHYGINGAGELSQYLPQHLAASAINSTANSLPANDFHAMRRHRTERCGRDTGYCDPDTRADRQSPNWVAQRRLTNRDDITQRAAAATGKRWRPMCRWPFATTRCTRAGGVTIVPPPTIPGCSASR